MQKKISSASILSHQMPSHGVEGYPGQPVRVTNEAREDLPRGGQQRCGGVGATCC